MGPHLRMRHTHLQMKHLFEPLCKQVYSFAYEYPSTFFVTIWHGLVSSKSYYHKHTSRWSFDHIMIGLTSQQSQGEDHAVSMALCWVLLVLQPMVVPGEDH